MILAVEKGKAQEKQTPPTAFSHVQNPNCGNQTPVSRTLPESPCTAGTVPGERSPLVGWSAVVPKRATRMRSLNPQTHCPAQKAASVKWTGVESLPPVSMFKHMPYRFEEFQ